MLFHESGGNRSKRAATLLLLNHQQLGGTCAKARYRACNKRAAHDFHPAQLASAI